MLFISFRIYNTLVIYCILFLSMTFTIEKNDCSRLNTIASDDEMDALVDEVDQLRRARREGKAFTDFSEAPIHFAPTYRIIVTSLLYRNCSFFLRQTVNAKPSEFYFHLSKKF